MKKLSKKDWSKLGTGVTCLLVAGMCWQYRTHLHGRLSTPSSGSRSVSSDGDNTFEGKVVDASGENISFITADADLTLLASKLPLETLATLKNASGKKERVTVFIPPSAIGSTNPVSVRADCTELPIKYEELVSRANDPKTTNSLDFLKSLPQGTMQTFTFVHDSKSLQKEGVDKLWPRVIRLSADAKLMFSYTCNPSAKTYNTVEVIRFDESTASYRFTEFDFRLGFFKKKVKEDPASCLSCHSPDKKYLDPRPIWQMYSTWDGVYGGNDDHFDSYQDGGYMTSYQDFKIGRAHV